MTDVVMPRLSDSMEEGTIIRWLKEQGEPVRAGEEIAEIETDKATMTYEADADGFLQIVAHEGDTLAIGATIARLLADAADASAAATQAAADAPQAPDELPPSNGASAAPAPSDAPPPTTSTRVKASPVARRVAGELGVSLEGIAGSGPDGRIVKADVVAAAAGPAAAPPAPSGQAPASADGAPGGAKGDVELLELSRTQQLIARRMASAKATIPEFTVTVDVDAEAAFALREQLRGAVEPLPSLNDFVVKACALALRAHPEVNAAYVDGHFERYSRVNIGVAVASAGTLVVPTVFDADTRSLVEIAVSTRSLAQRVRDGSVSPPELAGGTFTVSNLGMFGVSRFNAVINPPQAAILAVGAAQARAVPQPDGSIASRRVMELTISADHRIVYGADAAAFLGTVRERLEHPLTLLIA
jgi:pyruvate dehydrogenase E2 component (dihydrolipoamide acetyltransferase)